MIALSTRAEIAIPIEAILGLIVVLLLYHGLYWRWRNPEAARRLDVEAERRREQRYAERVRRERERNARR